MNVFQDILRRIAERVEGTQAVSLVGLDGIPIDSYGSVQALPIESIAAELGGLLKSSLAAETIENFGSVEQISILTDRMIAILSRVTEEYYLLLLLARGGNLGRGRFELRRAAAALEKELL